VRQSAVSFRNAVGEIQNAKVKNALTSMLNAVGGDLDKFRESTEGWFNSTMNRVSGWYKRRSQLIVFLLGIALAGVMDVNSVSIANDLWVHKAERDRWSPPPKVFANHPAKGAQSRDNAGLKANAENSESYGLPIGWNAGTIKNIQNSKRPCVGWSLLWVDRARLVHHRLRRFLRRTVLV